MEDLLKQVLSDETLYASAKTLFAYLYVCNRECTKYNHEILTENSIDQKLKNQYLYLVMKL